MKAPVVPSNAMTLGPFLTLLLMLRSRSPRSEPARRQGPTLPPGCALVVRYASR